MKELWKDIYNFEGKYQVSNLGRVRVIFPFLNIKNNQIDKYGYNIITKEKLLVVIAGNTNKGVII